MMSSARMASRQALRRGTRRNAAGAMRSRLSSSTVPMSSSLLLRNSIFRPGVGGALEYSTESILRLRSGKEASEQPKVLYNAKNETENCGVGLIASLKSVPSRHVVDVADEMLVRMSHRGGCGCDPASGDGAGEFPA